MIIYQQFQTPSIHMPKSYLPPCWANEETLCVLDFTVRQRQVQPRQKSSNYTNSTKTESLSHLNARCNQVRHTLSVCSQCSEDSWHRYVSGLDGMFYIPSSEGNLTIHNRSLFKQHFLHSCSPRLLQPINIPC